MHLLLKEFPNQTIDAAFFALKASMSMVAHPIMKHLRIFPTTAIGQSLISVGCFRYLRASLDTVMSRPDPRADLGREKEMSCR